MIPVSRPLFIGNEKKYVNECIDSTWIGGGDFNEKFEERFSKYIGKRYAVAVSNGSCALDLAIQSLGLTKNDEVIVTNFTIISCISAIIRAGAKPVLIDIDPKSWNIDTKLIEEKITPKTKAIMAVHIYNLPVEMDEIVSICSKNNLILIEDSAEQIGQVYNGQKVGSFGLVSCFSFYSNKNITTGEGGMILTDDENIYNYCKKNRNLGFSADPAKRFIHDNLGYNYRMTNIQAAIGLAQLEQIDIMIEKRREIGNFYSNELSKYSELIYYPPAKTKTADNIYWVFGMKFNNETKLNYKNVSKKLNSEGIQTRPFFLPIHQQPIFNNSFGNDESFPKSKDMYEKGIYIPCGNGILMSEAEVVVKILKKTLDEF